MMANVRSTAAFFARPFALLRSYRRELVMPDLIGGITVGVVLLPQGLAFALLAGLPPAMGLYTAVVAAIVGALWGSSSHLQTGPTNTASALTLSILLPLAQPGSPEFIAAAGLVAVLAGLIRLGMGLARLGLLVNFVSDAVVVGFTAGAGVLIMASQLSTLLRVQSAAAPDLAGIVLGVVPQVTQAHLLTLAIGVATIAALIALRRINPRLPTSLMAIAAMTAVVWLAGLQEQGVRVLGQVPSGLPPLTPLPFNDLATIGQLATGALAIAAIGLVEATAIARSLSSHSGQRLDSNQEFVGQGLANIAAGTFSGYPCSASFNRSVLSFRAGAQTSLASVFAGVFVLIASFVLAPVVAQLPRAVIAAELVLAAWGMIDRQRIARIWVGARGDAAIMIVTLLATLLLPLQFAVLIGILMSLAYYILQTSTPQV
ncbi:MAG TPA: SulP family inorganic anion transporter, partial [Roseiflexaceae bacterium]|nr:SulP family inorganic anion transporter [Roseiflexaceae bacterium]